MYKPQHITTDTFYIGVNDRTKLLFENLWPLPNGVSYNSYIIKDEKVAVMDTVDICYADVYFKKLTSVLNGKDIDYLIINHMEPDHSGAVELLCNRYPNMEIVGNNRTMDMLKGFYNIEKNTRVIKDGDELNLGKHTLKFYLTPMVHWPETMMTHDVYTKTLFSGDAFGTFGALNGGAIDKQLLPENYRNEMIRYYSNIVGKFGSPVQKALSKIANVPLECICATHGPVWTEKENITDVVNLYDKMSKYKADKGLVVAYGSMYGNVEQLAEVIAAEVAENGVRNIVLHNLAKSHTSEVLRDVFKYKGLLIGSPTYNNNLYPAVENLISAIESRQIKDRIFGWFGGFTWAGAAVKRLGGFAERSGFELIGEPVEIRQSLNEDTAAKAIELGRKMADRLNEI